MKLFVRASLLAATLACSVAVPVFADSPYTTHESTSTCRTDESTGFTSCFASETDITTKEKHSGASDVRKSGTTYSTVVDGEGNILWSYAATLRQHDTILLASDGSAEFSRITVRLQEEITDGGSTLCTRTHVVVRGDTERVNQVTTTLGPC